MIQTLNRILKRLQAAESHIFQFIGFRSGYETILVDGFNLPLWKMMEWVTVGMMKFPTEWKSKKCSKPPNNKSWVSKKWMPD